MENLPGRHSPQQIPLGMRRGKPIAALMWNLRDCFSTCRANPEAAVAIFCRSGPKCRKRPRSGGVRNCAKRSCADARNIADEYRHGRQTLCRFPKLVYSNRGENGSSCELGERHEDHGQECDLAGHVDGWFRDSRGGLRNRLFRFSRLRIRFRRGSYRLCRRSWRRKRIILRMQARPSIDPGQ